MSAIHEVVHAFLQATVAYLSKSTYLLTAKYILKDKGCKDKWDTHFISSSLFFFNHIIFNTNKSKAMHTF